MHTKISPEKPESKRKLDGVQWQDFVNTATNLQVPQKTGSPLICIKTHSVSTTINLFVSNIPATYKF